MESQVSPLFHTLSDGLGTVLNILRVSLEHPIDLINWSVHPTKRMTFGLGTKCSSKFFEVKELLITVEAEELKLFSFEAF